MTEDSSRRYSREDPTPGPGSSAGEALAETDYEQVVVLELDQQERQMLIHGLNDWGGPAYGSNALAAAMGFADMDDLVSQAQELMHLLRREQPLSIRDWTRALVATEFAFVSHVLGTGLTEWTAINGDFVDHWCEILARLQRKLPTDSGALPA